MVGAIFRQDAEFKIKGGGLICLGLADVGICCSDVLAGGGLVVGAECWADLFDSVSEEEQFDDIVIDESVDGVGEGGESLCGPFRKVDGGDGEARGRPFLELPGVCAGPFRLLAVLPMARQ